MPKRNSQGSEIREPVSTARIEDAYECLTRAAFAVWLRMAVEPRHVLEREGIAKLALKFRYQRRTFALVLSQLRNAGYIRYKTPERVGDHVSIEIAKRPILVGYNAFVKL